MFTAILSIIAFFVVAFVAIWVIKIFMYIVAFVIGHLVELIMWIVGIWIVFHVCL